MTASLILLYFDLVSIELALKNHQVANWSYLHHFVHMITDLGNAALTGLAAQAKSALEVLWCEKKGGGSVKVTASNYPVIRYLRHHSDHSNDASSDAEVETARVAVAELKKELRRQGVM